MQHPDIELVSRSLVKILYKVILNTFNVSVSTIFLNNQRYIIRDNKHRLKEINNVHLHPISKLFH
jgi:hypothetical protein